MTPPPRTDTLVVPAMDCPAEEAVIRNRLASVRGIESLEFDFFNRRLLVRHSLDDISVIVTALDDVGMAARPEARAGNQGARAPRHDDAAGSPTEIYSAPVATTRELVLLGASGVLAFAAEGLSFVSGRETAWPVIGSAIASLLLGGLPTLRKGLVAVRTLTLNINFLMTVAAAGAALIGSWPEAAMVIFLFSVAELIEKYSLTRARNAVRALMAVTPESAWVKQQDGSFDQRDAGEVTPGSIVRVKPGERLALDGVVVSGASAVNQAPITGESIPVEKSAGDHVFAGSINGNGLLEFRTSGGKDETTIARIVRTVQEAQGQRAPTQRFVDVFARVYTPVVCVLAVLIAVVPPLLFHQAWLRWVYEALVLLVIACPCALVISTPVTVVSGLAAAARRGILVKGGVYLEEGRKLRVIALDKTGTITEGKPRVTDVESLSGVSPDMILRLAASLDAGSDHPVARAITGAWTEDKASVFGPLERAERFESVTGRGVKGDIGGRAYFLGNHRFAHERGVCSPEVESVLARLEAGGRTVIVLTDEREAVGVIAVADTPRDSSIEAIRELHILGLRTIMLSGDNQNTADAIAHAVGIDQAHGELLPEEKLTVIDELSRTDGAAGIGMVGDGINDAPALAKAAVGFAMGAAGTDTALEVADVALMNDDLRGVPAFVRLSRRTSAVLKQNITLAIGIKCVFFGLALAGIATLWMAVVADLGASLLVVGNGLRLLRTGDARRRPPSAAVEAAVE
jgi:Cd2+/Zn2+-exporting ATPase